MTTDTGKTTLRRSEGGIWRVRSTSRTLCYLDLDGSWLLRDWGPGSPRFPHDGEWVRLVEIRSPHGDETIRVGDRHAFTTDPGGPDYQWWIPRVCVAIEPVDSGDPLLVSLKVN